MLRVVDQKDERNNRETQRIPVLACYQQQLRRQRRRQRLS
jgi:hypothetical protein